MESSCLSGDPCGPKHSVRTEEIAYFRAKADYLRRVASAVGKPGFMHPAAIIRLLDRLAAEFESRASEIERELKMRRAGRG
jgi:hypothetical protein